MDTKYFGWISLIFLLFITTFGFFWFFTIIIALVTFLLGLITILYLQHGNLEHFLDSGLLENPLEDNGIRNGLKKVLSNVEESRSPSKSDARLTGSDVIDRAIREMLGYILRDHVHSWFHVISDDDSFDKQIKHSVQHCIIKVADRIKQVDWLSFLTTRLIDDVATHIKLYRQAKANIQSNNQSSNKNSPKSSPKKFLGESKKLNKIHRRNKSDTDLKWHLGNKESQKSVANSRFYSSDPPDDSTLSGIVQAFLALDSKGQLIKNEKKLEEYYIFLADILLFYILPPRDFACPSLRAIMGPLIACSVVKPVLNALAEPDTINYIIVKLCCREGPPAGEYLLSGIRLCSDTQELSVIRELVQTEIHQLRTGNTSDSSVKHQIRSLKYVQSVIDGRIKHLKGNIVIPPISSSILPLLPLEELLTKNVAISYYLDYLTQVNKQAYLFFYLNVEAWKISSEQHISDMQVNKLKGIKNTNLNSNDSMRDMALNLYEQYLGDSAVCHLDVPQHMRQDLLWKIQNKQLAPTENWFNDLQEYVYGKFKTEDVFLSDFWRSGTYIKLLEELDLLAHPHTEDDNSSLDNISVSSLELADHNTGADEQGDQNVENKLNLPTFKTENYDSDTSANMENVIVTGYDLCVLPISAAKDSINSSDHKKHSICDEINSQVLTNKTKENEYLGSQLKHDTINRLNYMKHTRSHSDTSVKPDEKLSKSFSLQTTTVPGIDSNTQYKPSQTNTEYKNGVDRSISLPSERTYDLKLANSKFYGNVDHPKDYELSITIIETGVVCESGRSWGVYALRVIRQKTVPPHEAAASTPYLKECWHVYRRYSHFLDLQKTVKKKFSDLSKLQFPAKKAFHNMDREVLEHRMSVLNSYMTSLCLAAKKSTHKALKDMLAEFCEPQAYDKKVAGGAVIKTIDTLVNPLRTGMRTIKNMPDHFLNSVDELVGGLSRALLGKEPFTADEIDAPDNPALRSALLLIDEAFDLKGRSQWLRRGVLGRVLQGTWLGGVANRRLLHLASSLAGHSMVLKAISFIQQSLWPDGERVTSGPSRDQDQMYRTKMAAKTALLSSMSDDLKHLLGSETTRSGVMNIFYLLQQKELNLRLLVVVLEDVLITMYPGIEKALANAKSDR